MKSGLGAGLFTPEQTSAYKLGQTNSDNSSKTSEKEDVKK